MTVLLEAERIIECVKNIAGQIAGHEVMWPQIIVPVMNGAMIFASDLLIALHDHGVDPLVVPLQAIRVKTHVNEAKFLAVLPNNTSILNSVPGGLLEKRILIVDTICDSGATLLAVKNTLQSRHCRSILSAALIWRNLPAAQAKPDFWGVDLKGENKKFLYGYGLDRKGKGRGAPFVYYDD